ncbi:MAG: GNAT family N-acetyltransferase [Rhodospirillaceae bacterium]
MAGRFADNSARGRFELTEDGHVAFANYRIADGRLLIPHVEAAMVLRGTGAASRLMEHVAGEARARQLKILPICSYAVAWFRRHREHQDLLD